MNRGEVSGQQPGWYPDPDRPEQHRWWDGQRWGVTAAQREAIDRAGRSSRRTLIGLGISAVVIVLTGVAVLMLAESTLDSHTQSDTPTTTRTPAPASVQAPPAPAPAPALTPEAAIQSSINGRVDVQAVQVFPDGQIFVTWHIKENLTEGITKDSARRDATDILQGVRASAVPFTELRVIGKADVIDQLGRTSTNSVVIATYSKATVDAIQFPTFNRDNIFQPGVADTADIAPPMRD